MRKLFIILLSALSLTAFAQQKKVAVYVTGPESGINKVLGDQLVAAFAKSGNYTAIERTASFLSELNREQGYQRSGAVSDKEIARLGGQFGVNYVCVVDMSDVFGKKYISARLIDVVTAEVINTANTTSALNNMDDLLLASNAIATGLTGKTAKEKGYEERQYAAQQASQEQQARRMQQDEYHRIENSLSIGYIQMNNLLVTIPDFALASYKNANDAAKKCRLGGYSDWRLPTKTEIMTIFLASRRYHDICQEFPDFRGYNVYRRDRSSGDYYRYWCGDKYYYEVIRRNGEAKVSYGHGTMDDTIARMCYFFFVRNK